MLNDHADALICLDTLKEELCKEKLAASHLVTKYDGTCTEYRNRIQELTDEKDQVIQKNKTLHREKKGDVLFSAAVHEYSLKPIVDLDLICV